DIAAVARYHNAQTNTATEQAPIAASALRVWPSPAHHAATLAADLRSAGLVHADLYDVLGRHVAALADEVHAAGPLQLALDLGGVAPGVYVVRLETPDGIATQRLVVR
ncbi:MAG TPA: T9SS type A sorting domain-containing protein, partial [Rhodothermales bacterium]|nr:T9SS type A sorting domain-containing protein [Rhodothermales bacterium]